MTPIERFNAAVETADARIRYSEHTESPEALWNCLIRLAYFREATELFESGRALGYFKDFPVDKDIDSAVKP